MVSHKQQPEKERTMNTDLQLDDLRQQMVSLRQQLDRQEIINDNLLRQSMSNKMSWIKRFVWFEMGLVPCILVIMALVHFMLGLSWWPFTFLAVMLVVSVSADYHINMVNTDRLFAGNLVETSQKLIRMKRQRIWGYAVGMVAFVIWLLWLLYELKQVGPFDSDFMNGFARGGFVGGIIGSILGFVIFRRMQRTNDELLNSIDQLNHE